MRTILIVDDNESVLHTLGFVVRQSGYRVLSAASGPAAVELMATELVDVALIDLLMPGMDGFQACAALLAHARERGRPLQVWLMTGAISPEAQKEALKMGAIALLAKPFNPAEFLAGVERHYSLPPAPAPATTVVAPVRT